MQNSLKKSVSAALSRTLEGQKVGYVRLFVFSKNAAKDTSNALQELKGEGVGSIILDLRDNVGGVVFSGYEVSFTH